MGTILKYIFYVALILVVYLVGRGIYEGRITEDTTVKQVGSNIATGTEQLVSDTRQAIDDHSDDATPVAENASAVRPSVSDSQRVAAVNAQRAATAPQPVPASRPVSD